MTVSQSAGTTADVFQTPEAVIDAALTRSLVIRVTDDTGVTYDYVSFLGAGIDEVYWVQSASDEEAGHVVPHGRVTGHVKMRWPDVQLVDESEFGEANSL